jgi:predicted methyltransferase
MPFLNADKREMLNLISSHSVVPVPLFKPVTDDLEAKSLVELDCHGVWRLTERGEALVSSTHVPTTA